MHDNSPEKDKRKNDVGKGTGFVLSESKKHIKTRELRQPDIGLAIIDKYINEKV